MHVQSLLEAAIHIAKSAGEFTLGYWRRPDLVVEGKADGTEVTVADRGAEAVARELIAERFPHDAILGEEDGLVGGSSGRTWIVDPIDGTYGFVRGVPLYSTLVALVDQDGPCVGVIHLPALGRTISAGRGLGCFDNDSPAQVNTNSSIKGSLVCTSDWSAASESQLAAVRASGARMRTWGDAYGYAMVAAGEAEAMVDPICSAWDLAPMPVIISEAGGRFSDLAGKSAFDSGNGLATNGHIHDDLLAVLSEERS